MVKTVIPPIVRVLILKSDRLCAQLLRGYVTTVLPGATCVAVRTLAEARSELDRAEFDLIVAGVSFEDGEIFDLVECCEGAQAASCRLLVVTARPARSAVRRLRELAVAGIFDASAEDPEDFSFALMSVSLGLPCLSAALARGDQLPQQRATASRSRSRAEPELMGLNSNRW